MKIYTLRNKNTTNEKMNHCMYNCFRVQHNKLSGVNRQERGVGEQRMGKKEFQTGRWCYKKLLCIPPNLRQPDGYCIPELMPFVLTFCR